MNRVGFTKLEGGATAWRLPHAQTKPESSFMTTNGGTAIKALAKRIAVDIQNKMVKNGGISNSEMLDFVREIKATGVGANEAACVLKDILIMARHTGKGGNGGPQKMLSNNWFATSSNPRAIQEFLAATESHSKNAEEHSNAENYSKPGIFENELAAKLASATIHCLVVQAYYLPEQSLAQMATNWSPTDVNIEEARTIVTNLKAEDKENTQYAADFKFINTVITLHAKYVKKTAKPCGENEHAIDKLADDMHLKFCREKVFDDIKTKFNEQVKSKDKKNIAQSREILEGSFARVIVHKFFDMFKDRYQSLTVNRLNDYNGWPTILNLESGNKRVRIREIVGAGNAEVETNQHLKIELLRHELMQNANLSHMLNGKDLIKILGDAAFKEELDKSGSNFLKNELLNKAHLNEESLHQQLRDIDQLLAEQLDGLERSVAGELEAIDKLMTEKLDGLNQSLAIKINGLNQAVTEENVGELARSLSVEHSQHMLHSQEVMQELSARRNDIMQKLATSKNSITRKMNAKRNLVQRALRELDELKELNELLKPGGQDYLDIILAKANRDEQKYKFNKFVNHSMLMVRMPGETKYTVIDPKSTIGRHLSAPHPLPSKKHPLVEENVIPVGIQSANSIDCIRHTGTLAILLTLNNFESDRHNLREFLSNFERNIGGDTGSIQLANMVKNIAEAKYYVQDLNKPDPHAELSDMDYPDDSDEEV